MQEKIADVLAYKGAQIHTVRPDMAVQAAVDLMATHNIGALIVMEGGRPVGLFHERDVLWKIVHERRSLDTTVREVMAPRTVTVSPQTSVRSAMRLMTEERVRHLPVVDDNDRLVGVVSIGDLTNWVTRDLEAHVGELVGYIHGQVAVVAMNVS